MKSDSTRSLPGTGSESVGEGRRGFVARVAQTAAANAATTVLAGGAGLFLASRLGAAGRGQYAAIQSWFGILTIVGELGLTASTCYHIARDSRRAADWLATSTRLLFSLGLLTGVIGLGLSGLLASRTGAPQRGFVVAFLLMPVMFAAGSWTFALQATDIGRWNVARTINAVVYASGILLLGVAGRLTVLAAVMVLVIAVATQAVVSWAITHRHIGRGRPQRVMSRPLLAYGVRSLAGTAPFALNARLDQVLLTVLVPSADLGNYAVAVALTLLATPVATAFGGVIMPRLAQGPSGDEERLVHTALVGSLVAGLAVVGPVAIGAPFLATRLLGPSFGDVPHLVLLLTPGAVLLGCNQVLGDVLRGQGRPLDVARSEGVGLMTTAGLLLVLVGPLGARGAAIASSVAYGMSFVLLRRQVNRQKPASAAPPFPPLR